MYRRLRFLTLVLALLVPVAAWGAQPKCPLEPAACLREFERMRERPWLGVGLDTDSTGVMRVRTVVPGSPAERAGVRAGDVLRSIESQPPAQWFAGKAGWGPQEHGKVTVLRGGREKDLALAYETIPEERFARIVGEHMIEAHLAYLPPEAAGEDYH